MTKELSVAIKIIKKVNKILLADFSKFNFSAIQYKKQKEIVTPVDKKINSLIIKEILNKFPNHDIVSEEAKAIDNPGSKIWFIDPLDGTTNFAYGFPEFATCLGLLDNKIQMGVVGLPYEKKIYYAENNSGAWCNKQKIHVSNRTNLKESMILFCGGHSKNGKRKFSKVFLPNLNKFSHFRFFSVAGIELTSIAEGRADACVMPEVHPWDVVAGIIIIKEAGGKVTNFKGEEWTTKDTTMVASNGLIHNKIIKMTKNV